MALYHSQRPQTFADVIGQDHIITTIKAQIIKDTVAHAYLFSGPRGVGKTTTARLIAKAVNVPKKDKNSAEPDNTHPDAIDITSGRAIDIIEIDAASNTGVDHVREHIIENAQFKPTTLKKKVFIIDEVHMLSTSAFNALLKTLEEPPAHVMFILATTEIHKLPETIISRCQHFTFTKVPYPLLSNHLDKIAKAQGVSVDSEVLEQLSYKSDGCVRDAVSLLEQALATGEKKITKESVIHLLPTRGNQDAYSFLTALFTHKANEAFILLNDCYQAGVSMKYLHEQILRLARYTMMATLNALPIQLDQHSTTSAKTLAEFTTPKEAVRLLQLLLPLRSQIQRSSLPQLPLEMLIIEWLPEDSQKPDISNNISNTKIKVVETTTEVIHPPITPTEKSVAPIVSTSIPKVEPIKENNSEGVVKPVVEEIIETKTASLDPSKIVSHNDTQKIWGKCIKKLEELSPSLLFILKTAKVVKTENNCVYIHVEHNFHKKKLDEIACKKTMDEALTEYLGTAMTTIVDVVKNTEDQTNDINSLASAFGGQVVS